MADVDGRRKDAAVRVGPQWCAESLDRESGAAGQTGDAIRKWPRPLADDLVRRADRRVRTGLRDLEDGPGGEPCDAGRDHQAGRARGAVARTRDVEQRLSGSRVVTGWSQGRVRRAGRNLGGERARWWRCSPRDAHLGARIANRLGARQPPHRLRFGARGHFAPVLVRFHHQPGIAAHEQHSGRLRSGDFSGWQERRLCPRRQGASVARPRLKTRSRAGQGLSLQVQPRRCVVT